MNAIPHITIQLVHIHGPLKGEIQELADPEIRIGRHPDCQVQFPKDVVTISRHHARIVREGNRFKLIDQSTNGTYVNGQRVPEAYLKDGDVIMFAEGGPKISFLTQTSDQAISPAPATSPPPPRHPTPPASLAPPPVSPPAPAAPAAGQPLIESVKVPLAIQYGPTLKSFHALPVVLGKGAGCDFVIKHPALMDKQVQIFFSQNQYWVKDLTGMGAVMLDGFPIHDQAPLAPDMQLALSAQGPKFRFLGGGRLAEIEDPLPEMPKPAPKQPASQPAVPEQSEAQSLGHKAGSLFKKFFSS